MEQKKSSSWWGIRKKKEAEEKTKTSPAEKSSPKQRKAVAVPIVRKPLMTKSEQKMYEQLCRALPYSDVFPQVSFNSLVTENQGEIDDWQDKQGIRNQFNRMVVDFVVYDPKKHEVQAIVELDDLTHLDSEQKERDKKRDGILKQAGYTVLRYTNIPSNLGDIIDKFKAIRILSS